MTRGLSVAPVRAVSPLLGVSLGRIGAVLAVLALIAIWVIRLRHAAPAYVSELGADGAPDAGWFALALGTVAAAGVLLGTAELLRMPVGPGPDALRAALSGESRGAVRAALLGGFCLILAGIGFLVATVYPCTARCPVPGDPLHTMRDTVHISAAIAGFALVAIAMLAQAFAGAERRSRLIAWAAAIGVAVIAGVGGLLALAHVATALGAWCELVATSIAILWCATRGVARARD
ncbi:DUF998 domain-containing protein [Mycetocola sp. JXN-3]|uniref:DUF998 domain-containing protein n=1 Tax=Mycetocola sp. JXN-3 TaxID=2116510 RepID=UPI00165D0F5F|nr:DUF998 domain-containing protein [Mycetocola sp. JXN-3]